MNNLFNNLIIIFNKNKALIIVLLIFTSLLSMVLTINSKNNIKLIKMIVNVNPNKYVLNYFINLKKKIEYGLKFKKIVCYKTKI